MLPACRTADETFAIPQFALTRSDIDPFMDELRGFHTAFRACFARQEPRDQFFNSMVGQFSALERKSIEPMALQVKIPAASCGAFRDPHQTNSVARFVGFSGPGYTDE